MTSTAHKTPEEIVEHQDSSDKLLQDARKVAKTLLLSKHSVVYTGAGISTSAQIPDFRGPQGVWTLRAQGKIPQGKNIEQVLPTYSHYALVELMRKGHVKHVVSTNCDGLHRRSGLSGTDMSELHGNCYKEICNTCGKEYLRHFNTVHHSDRRSHKTGRSCEDPFCGGDLLDTTVAFGENLPIKELDQAVQHANSSDFSLVLGTSMRVSPACNLPLYPVKNNYGAMCIVNLQTTPYDKHSEIRSFAKTDEFMLLVMKELGITEFDMSFDGNVVLKKENNVNLCLKKMNLSFNPRFLSTNTFCNGSIYFIGGLGVGSQQDRYPGIQYFENNQICNLENDSHDQETPYVNKARWGHSAQLLDDKIYLVGGFDHKSMYNDVNVFDCQKKTLSPLKTFGTRFSHRAGHSCTLHDNNLILFGGQIYAGSKKYDYLNDLHVLDLENKECKKIETKNTPSPRSQHSCLIHNDYMLVIGGMNGNTLFKEIHVLNLKTLIWKQLNVDSWTSNVSYSSECNIYPGQNSAILLKNRLFIYGLCSKPKAIVIDTDHFKVVGEQEMETESQNSCMVRLNKDQGVLFAIKENKWSSTLVKVE